MNFATPSASLASVIYDDENSDSSTDGEETGGEDSEGGENNEENPTPPEDGEDGGEEIPPNDGEQEEQEHSHVFVFNSLLNEEEKKLYVEYKCECGELANDKLSITFASNDGTKLNISPDANGEIDYSKMVGKYQAEISNSESGLLASYAIEGVVSMPETPDETDPPDESGQPNDSENSEESGKEDSSATPEDSENSDEMTETEKKRNKKLITGILITIGVLIAGGIATLLIIKKKIKIKG